MLSVSWSSHTAKMHSGRLHVDQSDCHFVGFCSVKYYQNKRIIKMLRLFLFNASSQVSGSAIKTREKYLLY